MRAPKFAAGVTKDVRSGAYPWQLGASVVCWVLLGVTLLVSRLGATEGNGEDPSAAPVRDELGDIPVMPAPSQSYWFLPYLPVLGVVVLLVAIALLLGRAWARMVLAVLGLIAVIALSMAAQWHVVPAVITFVAGSVFGLLVPAHRYLTRGADAPREA